MPGEGSLPQFEELLSEAALRLAGLRGEAMEGAISDTLRRLCVFLGADRSTLMEFSEDGSRFEAVYSWADEGITPVLKLDTRQVPWYLGQLRAGRPVACDRLPDDLPAEAVMDRETARALGLKSNLTVPVMVGGQAVCCLAAGTVREYRRWPSSVVRRLQLLGQLLTAAVHRRRQEQALDESQAEIERLNRRLRRENLYLQEEIRGARHSDEIVVSSPPMRDALHSVGQVAPLGTSVLLLGETGVGKELIARAIHEGSPRRERPLVCLNCAALPSGLVESELFGHEKGAFTGAGAARPGRFEVADGGTLFLDEVGDLPPESQAKLLRVLQEGTFERLGSTRTRRVDVRVIAATNKDLEAEARDGRFRDDLYYRLSVFPIRIPPLRDRPEDIEPLVWFFIHRRQKEMGRRIETVPPEALEALRRYDWPGNVRELENVIERSMILSTGPRLALEGAFPEATRTAASAPARGRDLDAVQRAHITSVLAECGWKINGSGNAAERLGLHPNTLRFRMRKLGIERPRPARPAPPA